MERHKQFLAFVFLSILCLGGQAIKPSAMGYAGGGDFHIDVHGEWLTMRVHEASLAEVVERVAQSLNLESHVAPDLERTIITLEVKDVPIRQGLDQLLANTNYVLTDRDLYVWARNESLKTAEWRERKRDVPVKELQENRELSEEELRYQAIYGNDSEDRIIALELLSHDGVEKAMPTIVQALNDQSPEVRGLALELLSETEGPIPVDQVAKIVADDPNPEQRMEAIVVLASRDEKNFQVILKHALNDSDPEVVELAKSILDDVGADFFDENLP